MPTMDAKNLAAGHPFQLGQAVSVLSSVSPGLGEDVSLQLKETLEERKKKLLEGNPAAYGDSTITSALGVFGGAR